MPRNPDKRHCSISGCRAWAVRNSDPPLCSAHSGLTGAPQRNQNARTHGFYANYLSPDEAAELTNETGHGAATTLDAEIVLTRVALRRILRMLVTGQTPDPNPQPLTAVDHTRLLGLAFQGVGAIARLLRARHALGGERLDAFEETMNQALDHLGKEWGIDL